MMHGTNIHRRRTESLNTLLDSARTGKTELTSNELSCSLFYGLDHGMVSPDEASEILQYHLPADPIVSLRFAPRLLARGNSKIWNLLWSEGSLLIKEWLLVSAFDQLAEDVWKFGLAATVDDDRELQQLFRFLCSWNGGPSETDTSCKQTDEAGALAVPAFPNNLTAPLFVIGFSGVGKSSLCSLINTLGVAAVDVDHAYRRHIEIELAELFSSLGAKAARALIFSEFLKSDYADQGNHVLVMGGSTTSMPEGRRLLTSCLGPILQLDVTGPELIRRLRGAPGHPIHSFTKDDFGARQIMRIKRLRADHFYMADFVVNTEIWNMSDLAQLTARMAQ